MTNFSSFIALLAIFNTSYGFGDRCQVEEILMLPAPEDVYQADSFSNATILPTVFTMPPTEFLENVSPVFESPELETYEYDEDYFDEIEEEDVEDVEDVEEDDDDVIHEKSMKIAGFVAQCIVFLFVFTIVTMDVEQFDTEEQEDVVVHKLHKAVEIQTCPLPARQNIRIIRRLVESEC